LNVVIIIRVRHVSLPGLGYKLGSLKNACDYKGRIRLVRRNFGRTIESVKGCVVIEGSPQVIFSGVIVFILVSNVSSLRIVERYRRTTQVCRVGRD
jgi:hypothetical protein